MVKGTPKVSYRFQVLQQLCKACRKVSSLLWICKAPWHRCDAVTLSTKQSQSSPSVLWLRHASTMQILCVVEDCLHLYTVETDPLTGSPLGTSLAARSRIAASNIFNVRPLVYKLLKGISVLSCMQYVLYGFVDNRGQHRCSKASLLTYCAQVSALASMLPCQTSQARLLFCCLALKLQKRL